MIRYLERAITSLEKSEGTFLQFFAGLLSIMMIRTILEILLDAKWSILPRYPLLTLLHYASSYFAMLLTIVIIIALLARHDVVKVFKLGTAFFLIILTAPLLDTLLNWKFEINIAYIQTFDNLVRNYFTFFGDSITIGLRIEIFLICLLSAVYIHFRTKKILPALAGFALIYTSLLSYFIMPLLLIKFNVTQGYNQHTILAAYLYAITLLLVVFFRLYNREKFYAVMKNLRLLRITHYLIMIALGAWLATQAGLELFWPAIPAAFALFFAWQFAVATNDIEDVKIDAISNKDRPLASSKLSSEEMKILAFIFFTLSLCFAYLAGDAALMLMVAYHALYYSYSIKPFRIKKYAFITNVIIGGESLIAAILGYAAVSGGEISSFPKNIAVLIFFSFWLGAYIKDLKDFEGDKKEKIYTIPVLFGLKKGKVITGVLLAIAYLLPLILLEAKNVFFIPAALALAAINQWAVNREHFNEKYVFINYYVYALLIFVSIQS